MQRILAAALAMMVTGTSAWSADAPRKMPVKVAPTPAPVFSWTGCYVGGHVGGGWGTRDLSDPAGFALSDGTPLFGGGTLSLNQSASGFLGGAQSGCKYEFATHWIVGIDGDFSAAHLVGDAHLVPDPFAINPFPAFETNLHVETDWVASAAAVLGYSVDGLLLYAKGGPAWTHNRYEFLVTPPSTSGVASADFREQETRAGWVIGAGVEYPFAKNFSTKIEYDYFNFGTKAAPFLDQLSSPPSPGVAGIKESIHAVKFGLNYYFWNVPAPTPAASADLSAGLPAPAAITWSDTFSSEARYFSWRGTRGFPTNSVVLGPVSTPLTSRGGGSEFYLPYAAQIVGQSDNFKIEMLARGGYVWARQNTTGLTGEVATATDTVTSSTITYLGLPGIQPFVSLDLNLPTGLAALPANAVNARMDPDLVDVATFGEGLNVGPTLGFNLPFSNSFILTMSAGYTNRGTFTREAPLTPPAADVAIEPTKIKPGDVFTATSSVGYQVGQFTGKLTGTVSQEGTTTEDNVAFLRSGTRYLLSGTGTYSWPQEHVGATTLTASAAHSNRNEVLFQCLTGCPTSLVTEPFNTNSNVYQVSVQHLFNFGQVNVGPTGSFLFRDHNGYDSTTLQFVPAKERWSSGVLTQYAPNNAVTFNGRIEHVWTHENDVPGLTSNEMFSVLAGSTVTAFPIPVVSSDGWQFVLGVNAKF